MGGVGLGDGSVGNIPAAAQVLGLEFLYPGIHIKAGQGGSHLESQSKGRQRQGPWGPDKPQIQEGTLSQKNKDSF